MEMKAISTSKRTNRINKLEIFYCAWYNDQGLSLLNTSEENNWRCHKTMELKSQQNILRELRNSCPYSH